MNHMRQPTKGLPFDERVVRPPHPSPIQFSRRKHLRPTIRPPVSRTQQPSSKGGRVTTREVLLLESWFALRKKQHVSTRPFYVHGLSPSIWFEPPPRPTNVCCVATTGWIAKWHAKLKANCRQEVYPAFFL